MKIEKRYLFNIDDIVEKVYNDTKKKYKKRLNGREKFAVKIVIPCLRSPNCSFVRDNINIRLKPNEPEIIEKHGCVFYIFDDFYSPNENKLNYFLMYHSFTIDFKEKDGDKSHSGKFRVDYRLI